MIDKKKLMSDLEGLTYNDWHMFHCDTDVQGVAIDALEFLKAQPEIIHCKDCVHHHYESSGTPYCDNIDYGYGWRDDDFCSRAERKVKKDETD